MDYLLYVILYVEHKMAPIDTKRLFLVLMEDFPDSLNTLTFHPTYVSACGIGHYSEN